MFGDTRALEAAKDALKDLDQSLTQTVEQMVEVLQADAPAWFTRSARQAFVDSAKADELDDKALAALKAETGAASEALAARLGDQLSPPEVWEWQGAGEPPQEGQDLSQNPRVTSILNSIGADLADLLARHGIGADPERTAYRLPSYFVGGHLMRSLVETYWRTLAMRHEVRRRLQAASGGDRRRAREQRWDRA